MYISKSKPIMHLVTDDGTACRTVRPMPAVTPADCKKWLNSPITEALLHELDMCGIALALQYDESVPSSNLHLIIPFDIKKAMVYNQQ